jgi:hypothetical protein
MLLATYRSVFLSSGGCSGVDGKLGSDVCRISLKGGPHVKVEYFSHLGKQVLKFN